MPTDLGSIFKAYDIRGTYPDQLNEDAAFRVGRAFARWTGAAKLVLGRDCRVSSPALSAAFADGATGFGTGVVDAGLATTDMVYFASGRLDLPGVMFTASHNPPAYNGIKLCRERAAPVGEDTGLREIRALAEGEQDTGSRAGPGRGAVEHVDFL